MARLAPWSQTGLSSSSQSSSVTCAYPMASNRSFLIPTHPKKTAKVSEHVAPWLSWRDTWMQLHGPRSSSGLLLFQLPSTWRIDQSTQSMAIPLLRCFTEASLTFHIFVFGCQSFVLNEVRNKLDSKAREAILLGNSGKSKGYVAALTDWSEIRAPKVWVSYHETSTSTTMNFLANVVLESPKRRARTMMRLNWMLMIWN